MLSKSSVSEKDVYNVVIQPEMYQKVIDWSVAYVVDIRERSEFNNSL